MITDLADSPLASHRDLPSDHCDTLRDHIMDAFAERADNLPATRTGFMALAATAIDAGMRAAGGVEECAESNDGLMLRLLMLISGDTDRRLALRAICYLRLIGREGRSFDEIGEQFGVTRQLVQGVFRGIQRRFPHIHSRGDRCDETREACAERRRGKRKLRVEWSAKHLWKNPMQLPPPPKP